MRKIFILLGFIFYSPLSFSQETEMRSGVKVIKNATEYAFNLKDSVRSARFFYSYIKESLNKNERGRAIMRNFNRQPFYAEFDKDGALKRKNLFSGKEDFADAPIDSSKSNVYEVDEEDKILKRNFKLKNIQVYPIYINEKININFIIKGGGFDKFIFKYIYINTILMAIYLKNFLTQLAVINQKKLRIRIYELK